MELASCSFGQSSKITYLQMANAVAAICNGGQRMRPYLVSAVCDGETGRVETSIQPQLICQALAPETSAAMCGLMEQVVTKGCGKNAYIAGYRVGGKSGTSQKLDSATAEKNPHIGSFVGMAPADDPQVVVLVCLDEPHSYSYMGGTISAPVVAEVLENTLEYLGVPRQYSLEEQQRRETTVPDLAGWEPEKARAQLVESGLGARVVGGGEEILAQTPAAGEVLPRGSTVLLYTQPAETLYTQVPTVLGQTLAQAARLFHGLGLNLQVSGPVDSDNCLAVWQSVPEGASLPQGSLVRVRFCDETVRDD